jgi:hypothetical protein
MKGVLLWCLVGVHVDKKIVQIFVCLIIDIYESFLHMVHEKNVKIQIQTTAANILRIITLGEKCNIYMHIFTNITL